MKQSYFLFAIFVNTFLFSQTKLIAYKSHSGNMNHFETSVSKNVFDTNDSNLGIRMEYEYENKIDSVILLDNDKAVVIVKTKRLKTEKEYREVDTISVKTMGEKNSFIDSLFLVKDEIMKKRGISSVNDAIIYLRYNKQNKTYKNLKKETPKPQIKKSEIKKESLLKNGLIIFVFIISGFIALHSWRKNRQHEN